MLLFSLLFVAGFQNPGNFASNAEFHYWKKTQEQLNLFVTGDAKAKQQAMFWFRDLKYAGKYIVPHLIKALEHKNSAVRADAAETIAAYRKEGKIGIQALIRHLDDPSPLVKEKVILALLRLNVAGQIPEAKLKSMYQGKDRYLKGCASLALYKIHPERDDYLEYLTKNLGDKDREFACKVSKLLYLYPDDRIGRALAQCCLDDSPQVRERAISALTCCCFSDGSRKVDPNQVGPVLKKAFHKFPKDADLRQSILQLYMLLASLDELPDDGEKILIEGLNEKDSLSRRMSICGLSQFLRRQGKKDAVILKEVVKRINDPDAEVRETVMSILGDAEDPSFLPDIVQRLKIEQDESVRKAGRKAIADIKDPSIGPPKMGYSGLPDAGRFLTTEEEREISIRIPTIKPRRAEPRRR